jgi:hypothetical protein
VAEPFELLAGLFGLHNGGKGKVVLVGGERGRKGYWVGSIWAEWSVVVYWRHE